MDLEMLQPDGTWKKIGTVDPKSIKDLGLFHSLEVQGNDTGRIAVTVDLPSAEKPEAE